MSGAVGRDLFINHLDVVDTVAAVVHPLLPFAKVAVVRLPSGSPASLSTLGRLFTPLDAF